MKRVIAFVDGFNMYHSIDNNLAPYYKWLDYRKLIQHFVKSDESLMKILFFTAQPRGDVNKLERHNNYIDILSKTQNIDIIAGNFTEKKQIFNLDKMPIIWPPVRIVKPKKFCYQTFEEKQTDVNLALEIFEKGINNEYDVALIFTGDSDIAPAIHKVQKLHTGKKFRAILPFNGEGRVICSTCRDYDKITEKILYQYILPQEVNVFGRTVRCPYLYPEHLK